MATDRKEAQALYDTIVTEIEGLLRINADRAATQQLHLLVPDILRLRNQVWREWLAKELRARYPSLFQRDMPFATLLGLRPDQLLGPEADHARHQLTAFRLRESKRETEAVVASLRPARRHRKKTARGPTSDDPKT
jgi:hypothetical protein